VTGWWKENEQELVVIVSKATKKTYCKLSSCYNKVYVLADYRVTGWWKDDEQELVVRVSTATKIYLL
jgi:hypothetical protein